MEKIPVWQTIGHAYGFAFGNFFRILGVVWLPFALIMVGTLALGTEISMVSTAMATKNFSALAHVWLILLPLYAAFFILLAMQIVGLTQLALGLYTGSPYFYFSLKQPLWTLIGAIFLVALLLVAVAIVFAVGGILFTAIISGVTGTAHGAKPTGGTAIVLGLGAIIAVTLFYCAFVYALVRQTFLLTPVVVEEYTLGLKRAWRLGRGNFWRMFLILLAIIVPLAIVELAFMFGFVMHGFPPLAANGATPDQIAAWNAANVSRIRHYWYIVYPGGLIISVLMYGYICSAQAFAYRSLVPFGKRDGAV